jgi:chromate transporter
MDAAPPQPPSFAQALRFWFKLGCISFGGPAGQIAIMQRELVDGRRWISQSRFLHALNYCMMMPGPEAQQLATYIGWLLHGIRGGLAAGGLFILPSLGILIGLSYIYSAYGNTRVIHDLFFGIKPAVVVIVLHAAWRVGTRSLNGIAAYAVAVASLIAIAWLQVPFPAIVLAAGLVGYFAGSLFAPPPKHVHGSTRSAHTPAVIDDDTPTPSHARFSWPHLVRIGSTFALLWSIPLAALTGLFTWLGTLPQMAWFFTKAALVTFGGAYAVLPYVTQGGAAHGWLTPTQMIDGLALGETTPGPLIMVVTFVGFVGGWANVIFGPGSKLLSGIAAALTVTWFTFLPSFLFIFAGGPLVESTRDDIKFTAPLSAISAAVVGVILNLALVFGRRVFFPFGTASFDFYAVTIALIAAFLLFRTSIGLLAVIGISVLLGIIANFLFLPATLA